MGIAVTVQHCEEDPCEDVAESDGLGPVLFVGPYEPGFFSPPSPIGGAYQNVTVNLPTFGPGLAVISVPHAALVGVCSPLLIRLRVSTN